MKQNTPACPRRPGKVRVLGLSILMSSIITAAAVMAADPVSLTIDASNVTAKMDTGLLVGQNIAAWWGRDRYEDPIVTNSCKALGSSLIRIPGGSWGDVIWWNGNGVRKPGTTELDMKKFKRKPYSKWSAPYGVWQVDYSEYAPGFKSFMGSNDGWHGHVDMKYLHEWIKEIGSKAMVIVNAGQGTPKDAAEWVKWAKKSGYDVPYWEIGNELGGGWEAGNQLPDGSRLNGLIYSRRFKEFAVAMKKMNPSIKIGCMDWVEDVLKYCGSLVDFVSIHTYPVNGSENNDQLFAKARSVRNDFESVRKLIRKYQPARQDKIGIGYTEWNALLPDTRGAVWYGIFLGEMFRNGAGFSTHFQLFDTILQGNPTVRNAHYYSFWLWRNAMGGEMVQSSVSAAGPVASYATRTADGLSVMLLNTDFDDPAGVRLSLNGFRPGREGQLLKLSRREHLWLDQKPEVDAWEQSRQAVWSTGLGVEKAVVSNGMFLSLPPASMVVLRIPAAGGKLKDLNIPASHAVPPAKPRLEIWFPPKTAYADTPLEGWVLAFNGKENLPYAGVLADGQIKVIGPGKVDRSSVRLAEGAARFTLTASKPGDVTVEVTAAGQTFRKIVNFTASVPQPKVLWFFDQEKTEKIRSHWKISTDFGIRPNQGVERIELDGTIPSEKGKREVLVLEEFPGGDKLRKENIRGVFFDIKTAEDFKTEDPDAKVTVVVQSWMNWWMVLGDVKLSDCKDWKTVTLLTDNPEYQKAMEKAVNVWFILSSSKPVYGSLFIDKAGLMIR